MLGKIILIVFSIFIHTIIIVTFIIKFYFHTFDVFLYLYKSKASTKSSLFSQLLIVLLSLLCHYHLVLN